MQRRHLWLLLVVALGVFLGYWWNRRSDRLTPPAAKPNVAIQDRKTLDFSSGKPVVKDSAQDKAIMDAAVKEMDDATKNITFAPTAPPRAEKQKAEPEPAPPK